MSDTQTTTADAVTEKPMDRFGFTHSHTIGNLVEALAKAQLEYGDLKKTKTAKVRSQKGDYSYTYATLEDTWDAIRKPLANNQLMVVQAPHYTGSAVVVTTLLAHASGEWMRSSLAMQIPEVKPQVIGSVISYLKRYSLQAMVGIAPGDDDDANIAEGHDFSTQQRSRPVQPARSR